MEIFNTLLTAFIFGAAIVLFGIIRDMVFPNKEGDKDDPKAVGIIALSCIVIIFISVVVKDKFVAKNIEPDADMYEQLYIASKNDTVGDFNKALAPFIQKGSISKEQAKNLISNYSGLAKEDEKFQALALPEPAFGSPLGKTNLLLMIMLPTLLLPMGGLVFLMSIVVVFVKRRTKKDLTNANQAAPKQEFKKLTLKDFKVSIFLGVIVVSSYLIIPPLTKIGKEDSLVLVDFGEKHPEYTLYNATLKQAFEDKGKLYASNYKDLLTSLTEDKTRLYKQMLKLK